jgi:hypothetical protein
MTTFPVISIRDRIKYIESHAAQYADEAEKLAVISKAQEIEYGYTKGEESDFTRALAIAKRRIIRKAEKVTK